MGQFPDLDLNYVASVLADIWGREHGCKVNATLIPKKEVTSRKEVTPQDEVGG